MIHELHLAELRREVERALKTRDRQVTLDARVLFDLLSEIENHRLVLLIVPREKREPALRD